MASHFLDPQLHKQIAELCAQGDDLVERQRFEEAFSHYRDALDLVPDPVEDWEAATWIITAIGDLYFVSGKFDKAMVAFDDAIRCPGGLANPFIHLRLGQCAFELGSENQAADELTRAYMGAGLQIFDEQNPKYLRFLRTRITI